MKRSPIKYIGIFAALFSICFVTEAQRGGGQRGGGQQNGGGGQRGPSNNGGGQRGNSGPSQFGQRGNNNGPSVNRGNNGNYGQGQRGNDNRNVGPSRQNQPQIQRNNNRPSTNGFNGPRPIVVNRGNNYNRPSSFGGNRYGSSFNRGINYGSRNGFYNHAPRYTVGVPYYGQRFSRINHPYINLSFGGSSYNYYNGIFYRPFGSYFQVVAPPIGIHINLLPVGYRRIYVGPNPYYYYNGIFYNQYQNDQYVVVDPPLGAKLPELPAGAKVVTINGQPYYENDGTYYAAEYNENNEILYTVVGVHGTLNDAQVAQINPGTNQLDDSDLVSALPPNCKQVTINGQKLYLSPDNIYYQEILDEDGNVSYQAVGSADNGN